MGLFPFHPLLSNRIYSSSNLVSESDNHYSIELEAVGFVADEIEVQATEHELRISSPQLSTPEDLSLVHRELFSSGVRRNFRFRNAIDPDAITAELHNGLLILTLPKKAPRRVDVSVNIGVSSQPQDV